jgi:hypothetical protein
MPSTTPNGLPYPIGTDRVMDGDDAIKSLATAVDVGVLTQTGPTALVANGVSSGAVTWQYRGGIVFVVTTCIFTTPIAANAAFNLVNTANAIPARYRPSIETYGAAVTGGIVGWIRVQPTGIVDLRAPAAGQMAAAYGYVAYAVAVNVT